MPTENGLHGANVGTNMSARNAWFAGVPVPAVNVGAQLAAQVLGVGASMLGSNGFTGAQFAVALRIQHQTGPCTASSMPLLRAMPLWACQMGLADHHSLLVWDSGQEVVELGVGDKLSHGVVDTGANQTVMNTAMAQHLGLKWEPADKGKFGQYSVAGGQLLSYVGPLKHLVQLRFGEGVSYNFWSVSHRSF